MPNPIIAPLVRGALAHVLTSKLGGRRRGRRGLASRAIGGLGRSLSIPMLVIVGFVAGYGYKTVAEPDVAQQPVPEVVRRTGEWTWQLYFSPKGGCTDAIVRELRAARQSVRVMAYSFTSPPIATALVDCHRRGVKVEIIVDQGQRGEKYTEADFVANAGIPTYMDGRHAIHHNKVIVIDELTVITGSFNFSSSAELRNAENLLVLRDPEMAKRYLEEWQRHQQHSERYIGRGEAAKPR
jgi:phosphatidylserine/phosphatidylglycerophosphate/cardiolipin synthase-like enzyme